MLCNEFSYIKFYRTAKGSSSHKQWGLGSQTKQADFFFFFFDCW